MIMKYPFIALITALMLASCFYKPVLKSEADDIVRSGVIKFEGTDYLFMVENVFQATYKEGGRGLTIVTGHYDQRVSVYHLTDGSLLARKKTGRPARTANLYLGYSEGNLWFYSFDNGIHSLDPKTLSIKLTQQTLFKNHPNLMENLTSCEWYEVQRYFQFNGITQQIIFTDKQGYRYALNTASFEISKIENGFRSFEPKWDRQLETHINFPEPSLQISGDLRKQLKISNRPPASELTFLDGKLIVERNPVKLNDGIKNLISSETQKMEIRQKEIARLKTLNGGMGPQWRTLQRDTLNSLENSMRNSESTMERLKKASEDISFEGSSYDYSGLLSPDSTSFFILHASTTAKDAGLLISRLRMNPVSGVEELWNTEIKGLFFDPSEARETNTFREVFSKGDPEFRFQHFELSENKFIIIWMLHACCLEINTGKILWKFRV
jgi:hypothetical protein